MPRPTARGRRTAALLAVLLSLCALGPVAQAQTAVVIGGALSDDNDAVWQRIVTEAGGRGARVLVMPTASGNPHKVSAQIAAVLTRHGAEVEVVPLHARWGENGGLAIARDPVWVEKVRRAQGVFFSGGAQEWIVAALQPEGRRTPMLEALWDMYQRGGVVAGTSAGAAIMSTTMFRDAQDVHRVMRGELRPGREVDQGLGFVGPTLFIDQHFLKRGRLGRMLPLMARQGYSWGLGVEENSAAVIHRGQGEIIGARGALLVDLSAARSSAEGEPFALRGARVSFLARGDRFQWAPFSIQPAAHKPPSSLIDPASASFRPYFGRAPFHMDILGDNTVVHAMTHLLDGPDAEVLGLAHDALSPPLADGDGLGFQFRFYKGEGTRGWLSTATGVEDYTVSQVHLDVTPVRVPRPLLRPLSSAPPAAAPLAAAALAVTPSAAAPTPAVSVVPRRTPPTPVP